MVLAFPLRQYAPAFVKRLVWDRKHRRRQTDGSLCPQDFIDLLTPRLHPTDRLVGLGCGEGNLLAALRARGWKGRYIGVDISERAIRTAK
jgi:SAM-dependent methyltransferase